MRLQVRSVLGDFAVLVAIVLWTSVDFMLAIDTPKLNVPTDIKPTSANRYVTSTLSYHFIIIIIIITVIILYLPQQ